jgi:hypothetical protein
MKRWTSKYDVTADWLPYRHWYIETDGEADARWQVHQMTGIPVDQLTARLA